MKNCSRIIIYYYIEKNWKYCSNRVGWKICNRNLKSCEIPKDGRNVEIIPLYKSKRKRTKLKD